MTWRIPILCILIAGSLFIGVRSTSVDSIPEPPQTRSATLIFAGDTMLDRYIRTQAQKNGYDNIIDHKLIQAIAGADYAVLNLEGPVTSYSSRSAGTRPGNRYNFTFTFAPEGMHALKMAGFDSVSLANNHTLNFGHAGMAETRSNLTSAGLHYFGDTTNSIDTTVINDISIALVGYNEFGSPTADTALQQIKNIYTDVIVVFAHWGQEYTPKPTQAQRALASAFVDAGADLIIGSHSHVIGEREVYKGTHIYYSLGNFIFDQYWEDAVTCGALIPVEVTKKGDEISIEPLSPIYSQLDTNGRTLLGSMDVCAVW